MALIVNNKTLATTESGFLVNPSDWNIEVAELIAQIHGISLTHAHWEIIELLRDYCNKGKLPPSMRLLSAAIKKNLDMEHAKSIYLMQLFGSSPAVMVARISGLSKPKNCL